jgi:Tetracyclin repressor-like, C-terminal domain
VASKAAVAAAALQRLALQTTDVSESGSPREDLRAMLTNAVAAFGGGAGRFVPALIRESANHAEIAELLAAVIQTRRASPPPGLYFLGLPWQHTGGSALLG